MLYPRLALAYVSVPFRQRRTQLPAPHTSAGINTGQFERGAFHTSRCCPARPAVRAPQRTSRSSTDRRRDNHPTRRAGERSSDDACCLQLAACSSANIDPSVTLATSACNDVDFRRLRVRRQHIAKRLTTGCSAATLIDVQLAAWCSSARTTVLSESMIAGRAIDAGAAICGRISYA